MRRLHWKTSLQKLHLLFETILPGHFLVLLNTGVKRKENNIP